MVKLISELYNAEYKLNDLCLQITDGKHGDCENQENSGYYFVSVKDIDDGSIDYSNARQITKSDFEETNKRTKLENDDILITNSGTIGKFVYVNSPLSNKTTFQKSVAILKPDKEKIFPKFLYYSLYAQKERLIKMANGTTQKNLLLADLRNLKIKIPPMDFQKECVRILEYIDDLITNNKKTNIDLENLITIIFNYWFLQFDFPNENNKPYKANNGLMSYNEELKQEIPSNWSIGSLDDIAEYINGLACQNYRPINENDKLPVIKITEMHDGITDKTEWVRSDIDEKHIIDNGDILFSWSATLETMIWTGGKGGLNQHIFKVIPNDYGKYYVYMMISSYIINFVRMAESRKTTMGHITKEHLLQSKIPLPPRELTYKFDKLVSIFFDKYITNNIENVELNSLKEFLLPLLLSGQLKFKDEV